MAAAVGLARVLLGRALCDLELRDGEDHINGVGAAGDFLAVPAVADGLGGGVSMTIRHNIQVELDSSGASCRRLKSSRSSGFRRLSTMSSLVLM